MTSNYSSFPPATWERLLNPTMKAALIDMFNRGCISTPMDTRWVKGAAYDYSYCTALALRVLGLADDWYGGVDPVSHIPHRRWRLTDTGLQVARNLHASQ